MKRSRDYGAEIHDAELIQLARTSFEEDGIPAQSIAKSPNGLQRHAASRAGKQIGGDGDIVRVGPDRQARFGHGVGTAELDECFLADLAPGGRQVLAVR